MGESVLNIPSILENREVTEFGLPDLSAFSRVQHTRLAIDDGRIEVDHLIAERALHPVAVDRRNYLFAYSDNAGPPAAVVASAKMNGLDPKAFLRHVRSRIAEHPINRIEELLPWNVAANLSPANHTVA